MVPQNITWVFLNLIGNGFTLQASAAGKPAIRNLRRISK
jgi:hypothetical protein